MAAQQNTQLNWNFTSSKISQLEKIDDNYYYDDDGDIDLTKTKKNYLSVLSNDIILDKTTNYASTKINSIKIYEKVIDSFNKSAFISTDGLSIDSYHHIKILFDVMKQKNITTFNNLDKITWMNIFINHLQKLIYEKIVGGSETKIKKHIKINMEKMKEFIEYTHDKKDIVIDGNYGINLANIILHLKNYDEKYNTNRLETTKIYILDKNDNNVNFLSMFFPKNIEVHNKTNYDFLITTTKVLKNCGFYTSLVGRNYIEINKFVNKLNNPIMNDSFHTIIITSCGIKNKKSFDLLSNMPYNKNYNDMGNGKIYFNVRVLNSKQNIF
jgi:hypothetical protein